MQLRHLRYFVTLVREGHFAKAAALCGISQPTLSAGLVALEQEFGRRLVERDRRYIGLTPHGEAMLPWAEQILGAVSGMASAVAATTTPLQGEFGLAAIPASLPLVGLLGEVLLAQNPGITLAVRSATSRAIEHGLHAFEVDAGLTYLDHEPPVNVLSVPLYAERYVFLARRGSGFDDHAAVSWEEAATQDLCLLHQGMQYRRILDERLAAQGLAVVPRATADSHFALFAMVHSGAFATIVPDGYARFMAGVEWARFVPFDLPEDARRIGIVVVNRDPLGPMARAALAAARVLEPMGMRPAL
jgi:DNA-binding transcriptional LysR family regulator